MTLPLSYSRLRATHSRSGATAGKPAARSLSLVHHFAGPPTEATHHVTSELACQPKLALISEERRLVAREGLEPSKPLGRQIYSLLRLTASLPRQKSVLLESVCSTRTVFVVVCFCQCLLRFAAVNSTATSVRGQVWSWRRDSNPRPADYKSAALPA